MENKISVCIFFIAVFFAAVSSVSFYLMQHENKPALAESDICYFGIYDSERTVYGMEIPIYNRSFYYNIGNITENIKTDCELLKQLCIRNKHRFGCEWIGNDTCECDISRASKSLSI